MRLAIALFGSLVVKRATQLKKSSSYTSLKWVERFGLSVSSVARFSSGALPKTGKSCKIWLNFDGKHSFFTKPIAIFRSWS